MFVFCFFLFLKPQSIKQAFLHWYLFTSTNNRLYFGIWTLQFAPLQWRPSGILPRPPPRICQRVRPWPIGSPQAVESFQKNDSPLSCYIMEISHGRGHWWLKCANVRMNRFEGQHDYTSAATRLQFRRKRICQPRCQQLRSVNLM